MLKLELDWAGDEMPELGQSSVDENVRVELVSEQGPAGWPVIAVYVAQVPYEPAHMAYMRLDGWLRDTYLVGLDEDEMTSQAEELGGMTVEV